MGKLNPLGLSHGFQLIPEVINLFIMSRKRPLLSLILLLKLGALLISFFSHSLSSMAVINTHHDSFRTAAHLENPICLRVYWWSF